jgi:LytS/YehU family sensor histidine kinase
MKRKSLFVFFCFFNFISTKTFSTELDSLKKVIHELQLSKHVQSDNNDIFNVALFSLIPFIVAFSFIVFVFYRSRREARFRQEEAELKQQVAEMEMKALRAQINPHFIFNCLNSIHRFMEANKLEQAGEYLIKFSNLIRMVLENSMHREVELNDDLFALRLYIEMEQVRMNYNFDYEITVDPAIDVNQVLVPPLIIQPFVENSIWHGLNNKPQQGTLKVSITQKDDMIMYIVEDDGVKTRLADAMIEQNVKKKSLGMSITKERLDILNQTHRTSKSGFTIQDKLDDQHKYTGKRVELWVPLIHR